MMRIKMVEEVPGQAAQVNHITWESGTLSAPPHSLSNRQVSKEPVEAEQPVPLPAKWTQASYGIQFVFEICNMLLHIIYLLNM